jgi:hypothetical protein
VIPAADFTPSVRSTFGVARFWAAFGPTFVAEVRQKD